VRMTVALVAVVVLAFGLSVTPAWSYSTGSLDRGIGIDTASDANAVVGLDQPSSTGGVFGGTLVTVTNRFNGTRTFVVDLRNQSAIYDVSATGDSDGDSDTVTVTLAPGESVDVSYQCTIGFFCFFISAEDIRFGVTAPRPGVYATMERVRDLT